MGKFIDLTGQRFGRLTVIGRGRTLRYPGGTTTCWRCRCDCGNETEPQSSALKSGDTKSCGCLGIDMKREATSKRNAEQRMDLTGATRGLLSYIREAGFAGRAKGRYRKIRCRCACGKQVTITAAEFINGETKSCGCLQKQIASQMFLKDLAGQRFSRWTVIERDKSRTSKSVYWKCRCDCDTEKSIDGQTLREGRSKSCGCLNREITSELMTLQNAARKARAAGVVIDTAALLATAAGAGTADGSGSSQG